MQTSTIMLDSTLDKILTTKQADERLSQNDVDTPLKRDGNSEENQSTRSEAEVRLVVRFIAEEQIVFKGKIERVKQLQSEELSRVVSRVAWDDATDTSKSTPGGENSLAQEKASVDSDEKPPQSKSQIQAPSSSSTQTPPPSSSSSTDTTTTTTTASTSTTAATTTTSTATLNSLTESSSASSGNKQADQVQNWLTSNENSSDHQACIKLYPQNSNSADGCRDLVAQVERHSTPENSVTKKDCDIDLERPVNHICEAEHQRLQISPLIQEPIQQDSKDCNDLDLNPVVNSTDQIDDPQANDSLTESQSVAEALNECVNNVDREIRQTDEFSSTDVAHIQIDGPKELSWSSMQHSLFNGLDSITDVRPESTVQEINAKQKNMIFETSEEYEDRANPSNENPIEIKDKLKQSCDYKKIPSEEITNKVGSTGSSSSGKRKTTGEHSSAGKRIRRIASKDQRNQGTRHSANKGTENSLAQQTSSINKIEPGSLLANNQHTRQNKVFAKWSDNHFYPGTILKLTRDRKFHIGFFDGAQRSVAETDIIPLRNVEGKQVRMSIAKNYCVNAIVHNLLSPVSDQPMFDVEYQQEGSVRKCVPLSDIFLTGEQGTPLISQPDKISGVSNFADVDLDNIIYEKRSRRLQEMEDFELTENTSSGNKRKRGQYSMRNTTPRVKTSNTCSNSPTPIQKKSQDEGNQDSESAGSPDVLKTNFLCPNSNPPSESSSSTGSSNVPNVLELNQEFYFSSSSPHRTKTSLLL